MSKITLTPEMIAFAEEVGRKRQEDNDKRKRKDAYGFEGNGLQTHIEGALCELAVALYFELEWVPYVPDGAKRLKTDVGPLHVRSTKHTNGRLILHPKDPDDGIFILVVNQCPVFDLKGAIRARDGKKSRYWPGPNENRPAFFVPADTLIRV